VVAQRLVPIGTSEIAWLPALLDPIPLAGGGCPGYVTSVM
jgi:hypothetical protein